MNTWFTCTRLSSRRESFWAFFKVSSPQYRIPHWWCLSEVSTFTISQTTSDPRFSSKAILKKSLNNGTFVFQDPKEFLAALFPFLSAKCMERITRWYVFIRWKSELENMLDRGLNLLEIAFIQSVRRSFHSELENTFCETKTTFLSLPCGKNQKFEQPCFRVSQKKSGWKKALGSCCKHWGKAGHTKNTGRNNRFTNKYFHNKWFSCNHVLNTLDCLFFFN